MAKFVMGQQVRTTSVWAKEHNRLVALGRVIAPREGPERKVRVRLDNGGSQVYFNEADLEEHIEHPLGEMVWLGDLSGWWISTREVPYEGMDLPTLVHRCGKEYELLEGMNFMANLIREKIQPHVCT